MGAAAAINLENLAAPLAVPDAGGIYIYPFGGEPWCLDSAGNTWQLNAPRGDFLPGDQAMLEWNLDPAAAGNVASTVLTTATVNLARVNIRTPTVVNNIWFHVTSAAVTVTASKNFVGVYNSAGTLLGASAVTALDTKITSTGIITQALTGPVSLGPGFYWVAALFTATGTMPTLATAPNSATLANAGLTAVNYRWATNGTGTVLAGTITPSSNALTNAQTYWAGVS